MPGLGRESLRHLEAVGETYFEHMRFAATVGRLLVVAGFACLVNAVIPALFQDKASRTIRVLNEVLDDRARLVAASEPRPFQPLPVLTALSLVAAGLPWLGGATVIAAPLSALALAFPLAFVLSERRQAASPAD